MHLNDINIPLKYRNSIRIEHSKIGQKKFYKKLLKIDPKIKNQPNEFFLY